MSETQHYPFPEEEQPFTPEPPKLSVVSTGISTSQTISKLIEALAKAQLHFKPVLKQSENPAFMRGGKASKYADLNSVVEATRPSLAAEGLVVTQWPSVDLESQKMTLITILAHSSGEWMKGSITMKAAQGFTVQTLGGFLTYMRRYTWSAIVGVAPEDDDDGNQASGVGSTAAAQAVGKQKVESLQDKLKESVDSLFYVWFDASQTAEIKGSSKLMDSVVDLLKPFVTSVLGKKQIIVNSEQLENLKYEMEQRKIPFHPLKAAK